MIEEPLYVDPLWLEWVNQWLKLIDPMSMLFPFRYTILEEGKERTDGWAIEFQQTIPLVFIQENMFRCRIRLSKFVHKVKHSRSNFETNQSTNSNRNIPKSSILAKMSENRFRCNQCWMRTKFEFQSQWSFEVSIYWSFKSFNHWLHPIKQWATWKCLVEGTSALCNESGRLLQFGWVVRTLGYVSGGHLRVSMECMHACSTPIHGTSTMQMNVNKAPLASSGNPRTVLLMHLLTIPFQAIQIQFE